MSPFKSSAGRQLGKMLEGFKSSDVGKGFGAGGAAAGGAAQATGGEVLLGTSYVDGNKTYRYHYFKAPGSFIMPDKAAFDGDLDVLVVAGGGSGGPGYSPTYVGGGGGGAGGVISGSKSQLSEIPAGNHIITVGGGGANSPYNYSYPGNPSSFGDLFEAIGGGRGGSRPTPYAYLLGGDGGSGGGATNG